MEHGRCIIVQVSIHYSLRSHDHAPLNIPHILYSNILVPLTHGGIPYYYTPIHRHEKVPLTGGPKICRVIDYMVNFLSLQIYCLKSVGAKAFMVPMGNPPMLLSL